MKKSICFFTLVELLTVIAVIAILAGIAVPVIVGMSSKGKETTARADMNSIKLALTQFKADYSVWPVTESDVDKVYYAEFNKVTTTSKDDEKIDILMQHLTLVNIVPDGTDKDGPPKKYDSGVNTKKRVYLDVPAKPVIPSTIAGKDTKPEKGGFIKLDPWNRRYNIALDWNYDKRLVLPKEFSGKTGGETIAGDIAIFSYGDAESTDDYDAFLYSWKTVAD